MTTFQPQRTKEIYSTGSHGSTYNWQCNNINQGRGVSNKLSTFPNKLICEVANE